jgi:hypothetical protein
MPYVPTLCAVTRAPSRRRCNSSASIFRLAQPGRTAERNEPIAVRGLALLNDAARRMIFFRQLNRRVGERATALVGIGDVVRHLAEPGAQLCQRVARMHLREPVPAGVRQLVRLPQTRHLQFVLRGKVAIKRHLVGAGRLGDRLDPDRPDSMPIEQLASDRQEPRTRRDSLVFSAGYSRSEVLWTTSS